MVRKKDLQWEKLGKKNLVNKFQLKTFQCFISQYGQFKFPYLERFDFEFFSENQKNYSSETSIINL